MTRIQKEMMALVGACVQEGINVSVPAELNGEFDKIITAKFNISNDLNAQNYDLIIEKNPGNLIKIHEKLNENGSYITTPSSLYDRELFANLSKLFYIVMPYYYIDEDNTLKPLVYAGKKYHPSADLIRHRSDFIQNAFYYHTDIHLASFILPKYVFENIKDVIKL